MLSNRYFQIAIIVALTVLAYSNIFTNGFVWDDQFFIQEWEKVKDWKYLPDMLRGELPPRFSGAFRPLLGVFYLVFYQLFGQNPLGWHLQSLVVHLANTVLVYLIVSRLSYLSNVSRLGNLTAFATALLFGLHPIHTEAVTYIAASINNIGAMFFFLSFYFYLARRPLARLISLLFSLLAFFTYEFTLTLPLLIVLHRVLFPRRATNKSHWTHWTNWSNSAPYFALAGLYLFLRVFFIRIVGRGEYLLGSFPLTMLTMTKALLRYLEALVLPLNQTVFHTLPGDILANVYIDLKKEAIAKQSVLEPAVILSIIVIIVITAIMVIARKRAPLVTFAIAWFFISLLPASNIVPVQEIMAERYLYIPSFGFVLLVGVLFERSRELFSTRFAWSKNIALGIVVLVALSYSFLSYHRNTVWQSNFTLWLDTTKKSPLSEIAHYNLGNAYLRRGQLDLAEEAYKKAIANKPESMGSYINLGTIYHAQGRLTLAKEAFEGALAIDPTSPSNHNNLGTVLASLGEEQLALEHFLVALLIDAKFTQARENVNLLIQKNSSIDIQWTLRKIKGGL